MSEWQAAPLAAAHFDQQMWAWSKTASTPGKDPAEFRPDARFRPHDNPAIWRAMYAESPATDPVPATEELVAPDPVQEAYLRGFADGEAEAQRVGDAAAAERSDRIAALDAALLRIGEEEAIILRERMRQTLLALCEATILPAALDVEALERRIDRAARMLVRAQADRCVRLNPDDLALVGPLVSPEIRLEADPGIERGGLRIDTDCGGVEDSPASWRAAIAEALGEC